MAFLEINEVRVCRTFYSRRGKPQRCVFVFIPLPDVLWRESGNINYPVNISWEHILSLFQSVSLSIASPWWWAKRVWFTNGLMREFNSHLLENYKSGSGVWIESNSSFSELKMTFILSMEKLTFGNVWVINGKPTMISVDRWFCGRHNEMQKCFWNQK